MSLRQQQTGYAIAPRMYDRFEHQSAIDFELFRTKMNNYGALQKRQAKEAVLRAINESTCASTPQLESPPEARTPQQVSPKKMGHYSVYSTPARSNTVMIPETMWRKSSLVKAPEFINMSQEDPLVRAREARLRKAQKYMDDGNLTFRSFMCDNEHRIVRDCDLKWNRPSTNARKNSTLTKLDGMRNSAIAYGYTLAPERKCSVGVEALKEKCNVTLRGYLAVMCPEQYHRFLKPVFMSILVQGKVKIIELLFDFDRQFLTLTRRGEHPTDVRRREVWLGHISKCSGTQEVEDHIRTLKLVSPRINFAVFPFCGLYVKGEARPAVLMHLQQQIIDDLVTLINHTRNHLQLRIEQYAANLRKHGVDSDTVKLQRNTTLRAIVYELAAEQKTLAHPIELEVWKQGVSCNVVHGTHISKNAKIFLDLKSACMKISFNDDKAHEWTPHPNLEAAIDRKTVIETVKELNAFKQAGILDEPATFLHDHSTHAKNWNFDELFENVVAEDPVILKSPKWRSPIIVTVPTGKKSRQLGELIFVLNTAHSTVMSGCG
eukprot:Selendium_serpulae@DN4303_c0_g1_i1.p1